MNNANVININAQEGVRFVLFPDNQPHVIVDPELAGNRVSVRCRLRSSLDVMHLLQVANALDNLHCKKGFLYIPYLLGARSDRVIEPGSSVDLKVVADMINYCNFEAVHLLDVHSSIALQLINRSVNHDAKFLLDAVAPFRKDTVIICPDAGAVNRALEAMNYCPEITDIVYCIKHRDKNGQVRLRVIDPEICRDRNCVVVDDICDGGATFTRIAEQVDSTHLTLVVTHGIFSKGVEKLESYYDMIYLSDSYQTISRNKVTTIRTPDIC